MLALVLRIAFSWISMDPSNPLYTITHDITEPVLAPIRQFMPRIGGFDFSPMIASLLLVIIFQAASSLG